MQELRNDLVNLWDGIGLGGSQKCELATADEMGWDYEETALHACTMFRHHARKGKPIERAERERGGERERERGSAPPFFLESRACA